MRLLVVPADPSSSPSASDRRPHRHVIKGAGPPRVVAPVHHPLTGQFWMSG